MKLRKINYLSRKNKSKYNFIEQEGNNKIKIKIQDLEYQYERLDNIIQ